MRRSSETEHGHLLKQTSADELIELDSKQLEILAAVDLLRFITKAPIVLLGSPPSS
jgi:hypothetical protein